MKKLLEVYKANATRKNAQKIRAYERSHPMATCMLSKADADLVADAIHRANTGE